MHGYLKPNRRVSPSGQYVSSRVICCFHFLVAALLISYTCAFAGLFLNQRSQFCLACG
jgi:hypothetical protein